MSNCFEDIIGIKGQCGTITTPSSGLYINDLPLMGLKVADAVIGSDDTSGLQFIKDKINYAVNAARAEMNVLLSPYFKQKSLLENSHVGRYTEWDAALAMSANRRGIQLKIDEYPYLSFNLTGISLYSSNHTGSVTIKVHDLITGQEIDSFAITITAGQIDFTAINKRYLTNGQRLNLFISYDATAISSFETNSTPTASGCKTCSNSGYRSGRYMIYNGAYIPTGSTVIYDNLVFTGFTSGLSIQYNIGCATDAFLCSMKNSLAWPILHKAGAEICREVVRGTIRVNSFTTIDKEAAEALMQDFEMEYATSMKNILHNVTFPNDLCFSCKQAIKSSIRIP